MDPAPIPVIWASGKQAGTEMPESQERRVAFPEQEESEEEKEEMTTATFSCSCARAGETSKHSTTQRRLRRSTGEWHRQTREEKKREKEENEGKPKVSHEQIVPDADTMHNSNLLPMSGRDDFFFSEI